MLLAHCPCGFGPLSFAGGALYWWVTPMRGARWLLLVAIAAIAIGIGFTYRAQVLARKQQDPARPNPLPPNLAGISQRWEFTQTNTRSGKPCGDARGWADDFRELKDSGRVDLRGVELRIPNKECTAYNLVKSAAGSWFKSENRLFAEGVVDITLKIPMEGQPAHTPVRINTSAANFDTTSYAAETDKPTAFLFEHGDGASEGVAYNPNTHQLVLKHKAVLHWKSAKPNAKAMTIEADTLEYDEGAMQVRLKPWGRLIREGTVLEGENPVINLQEDADGHKVIRHVDTTHAHGTDERPNRKVTYSADVLSIDFDDDGVIQKINGRDNARLVSTSTSDETTITAANVDMAFDTSSGESELTGAIASGDAIVASRPLPAPGRQLPESHVLRSARLEMQMRPGGHDIQIVTAPGDGTLEFNPNQPAQHHRILEGKNFAISYAPQNRIEGFRASNARTHTDPTEAERKRNRVASTTVSRELVARFDPKTSHLAAMEQNGDFTYEEGDRKARAAKAALDSSQDMILLDGSARISDATGSTSAERIRMNQSTGDFTAEIDVNSTRLPDKDPKKNSDMLSGDSPIQARARKMDSANHNSKLHYEGGAQMWQGANRIQADTIDLDRQKKTLIADGKVVTHLWEQPKESAASTNAPKKKERNSPPVLTVVHAPRLVYTDADRLAIYSGGATLERNGTNVKAREIRAFLTPAKEGKEGEDSDSRLEKAFADGAVEIVQVAPKATRTGTAEHAEYYPDEQRVFLRDGGPKMTERQPDGETRVTTGEDLTYFAGDDRLLVKGTLAHPGQTTLQRKAK